jgi:hypothetical protein
MPVISLEAQKLQSKRKEYYIVETKWNLIKLEFQELFRAKNKDWEWLGMRTWEEYLHLKAESNRKMGQISQ